MEGKAVRSLMAREAIIDPGALPATIIAIVFAALAALATRMLAPGAAALVYFGMVAAWTCFATLAFTRSLALPLTEPFLAGLAAMAAIIAYPLVVADNGEQILPNSFSLYLAAPGINNMLS